MKSNGKKCLVLGVNGQDGSYAAEYLLSKGYEVIGVGRQSAPRWLSESDNFSYKAIDLSSINELTALLKKISPKLIFNTAAIHGSANFPYEEFWFDAHIVNTIVTHAILEYLRLQAIDSHYLYLSSSKAFGMVPPAITNEKCQLVGTCIYSITKNSATELIRYYRMKHGIQASVVWTFNHESPRRVSTYFIPRIVDILANAILDDKYSDSIHNMNFWCDWGDANEYMQICVDLSLAHIGKDFVLGTGRTLWAREFVKDLFSSYGLNYSKHIDEKSIERKRAPVWKADISLLNRECGVCPMNTIYDVCSESLEVNYPDAWHKVAESRDT